MDIIFADGTREALAFDATVRVLWAYGVESTCLHEFEAAPDDSGEERTVLDMVVALPVAKAPQREWCLIRNESDGGWSVVDHVATRQANAESLS